MRKCFNRLIAAACVFVLNFAAPAVTASAADLSLGLGGAWQSSPYKGHDDALMPIPLVNVEWERFYINYTDAGMYIWKNENQAFSLGVSFTGFAFDPDKTDDPMLKKLDGRDEGLNAFLKYDLHTRFGQAGVSLYRDILGSSDAFSAEGYYKYPLMLGPAYVSPGVGLQWDSEKQLDYYYGISSAEALRSGLGTYSPDGGISPFLSLEAAWFFTDHWSIMAAGKVLFLNREIKDSPMVDTGQIFNAAVGITYTF